MPRPNASTTVELALLAARARRCMVDSLIQAGCGHPGGAFSCVDVLTALFFHTLRIDPARPDLPERDRFILSKGHSSVALYAVMALRGFFPLEWLSTFRRDDSPLGGHPDMHKVPGVEMSTGSLGHGLAVGVGLAAAAALDRAGWRTFVLLGDGETQEGAVWEAALAAAHFRLDNLTAVVDRNRLQIDGPTETVMALEPYADKWRSFGWEVRCVDGHDMAAVVSALDAVPFAPGRPSLLIADTIKGKGVSFMENNVEWHGKALAGEWADKARRETAAELEKREWPATR